MNTPDSTWLQTSAFDLLQRETVKTKTFPSALLVYTAIATCASDTGAEVTPEHDGRWFKTTIARLSLRSHLPLWEVHRRLDDLTRLGLIQRKRQIPPDAMTPFELRVCTIEGTEGKANE